MAADLRSEARGLASLIHQIRMTVHSARGLAFPDDAASVVCEALDTVRGGLAGLVERAERELTIGAGELEEAMRVLRSVGAEGRLGRAVDPAPGSFDGVYVPQPERPEYLADMAVPTTNVVILANVRRSRPEGGAR